MMRVWCQLRPVSLALTLALPHCPSQACPSLTVALALRCSVPAPKPFSFSSDAFVTLTHSSALAAVRLAGHILGQQTPGTLRLVRERERETRERDEGGERQRGQGVMLAEPGRREGEAAAARERGSLIFTSLTTRIAPLCSTPSRLPLLPHRQHRSKFTGRHKSQSGRQGPQNPSTHRGCGGRRRARRRRGARAPARAAAAAARRSRAARRARPRQRPHPRRRFCRSSCPPFSASSLRRQGGGRTFAACGSLGCAA